MNTPKEAPNAGAFFILPTADRLKYFGRLGTPSLRARAPQNTSPLGRKGFCSRVTGLWLAWKRLIHLGLKHRHTIENHRRLKVHCQQRPRWPSPGRVGQNLFGQGLELSDYFKRVSQKGDLGLSATAVSKRVSIVFSGDCPDSF